MEAVLDLDADDDTDAILATLRGHPQTTDAFHEDREVYLWETSGVLTREQAGALALSALLAGHQQAAAAADTDDGRGVG